MSLLEQSAALRRMIEGVVRDVVQDQTASCFRVYKAVVIVPPDGSRCSVRLSGDETVLSLPYSSSLADIAEGETVLVAVVYNNMRNAIVWQRSNFS